MSQNMPTQPAISELVSQVVLSWAQRQRGGNSPRGAFSLDGKPLSDADLADPQSFLPLAMWHADALYRYGINQNGLGAVIREDADALFHFNVSLDRVHRSASEVLCFVVEALEDVRANMPRCTRVPGAVDLRLLANRFLTEMGVAEIPQQAPSLQTPSARVAA